MRSLLLLTAGSLFCSGLQADMLEKLGPKLKDLIEAEEAGVTTAFAGSAQTRRVRTSGADRVQVYVYFEAFGHPVESTLEAMGVEKELINYDLGILQGWAPVDLLEDLAELPFVVYISVPDYARFRTGSVTSEGVAILRADDLHARGVTGRGVRVGVLSDGVNNMADAQSTGDLPSSITVFGSCIVPLESSTCNEGTAMLEIIHDVAPDADLGFCALSTNLEFINCVQILQSSFGADVFVDDIGFFGEPYFEDGPVAQAVANVAGTHVYVSAAGNDAGDYYEAQFQSKIPMTPAYSGGKAVHDFGLTAGGISDTGNTLQLAPGQELDAYLQWDDPFNNSTNDYRLWLMEEGFSTPPLSTGKKSIFLNDPLVNLKYTNPGSSPITVQLVVLKQSGDNRRLKMFVRGPEPEYVTPKGSVFGHPAVSSVVATAAINASDPGHNTIASYSSWGPTDIAFPVSEWRQKPDITAIDGVSVTGVGGFSSPFYGTSAAAPHAAGVAALLMSLDSQPSRDTVVSAMKSSAVDLGAPGTDNTYGAGRLDALAAFHAIGSAVSGGGDGGGGGCALSSRSDGFDPLLLVLLLLAGGYLRHRRFPIWCVKAP